MPAKLTRGEGQLELALKGHPEFALALDAVRAIPGRRFDPDTKNWCFPEDSAIAERLMVTVKPEVSPDLLSWIKESKAESQKQLVTPLKDDADILVPWGNDRVSRQPEKLGRKGEEVEFKGLFGYQRAFVDMVTEHAKLLLADDMGLGKCGQASSAVLNWQLAQSAFADTGVPPEVVEGFDSARDMLDWADIQDEPKLIIAPASVKGTWSRELRLWLGQGIPHQVVDATTPKARNKQLTAAIEGNAWAIVNWEQLRVKKELQKKRTKIYDPMTGDFLRWAVQDKEVEVMREPLFETTPWLAAIADEAHRAKGRKSLQTKGLWRTGAKAPVKLALTGTPLMNSPDELWPILKWLFPDEYTSYWRFFDQYVDYYEGQYGKIITGVKNADALRFELATRLVRRTKDEVLDLPDKIRQYVPVTMGKKQRKLYDEAEKQMWFEVEQAIKEGDKSALAFAKKVAEDPASVYTVTNGAARTVRLRQIASTPALLGGEDDSIKLDTAVEIIMDAQPKQIVVFSEFVGTCHALVERLRAKGLTAEAYTGEVASQYRTILEDQFQNGEIDVLVGTIAAMKEGITLTASDTMIFLERHWTPAVNEQCEDREHRVGQKHNVTIIIIEAEDSVDTQRVSVTNAIKSLIVSAVIKKDDVEELRV